MPSCTSLYQGTNRPIININMKQQIVALTLRKMSPLGQSDLLTLLSHNSKELNVWYTNGSHSRNCNCSSKLAIYILNYKLTVHQ